MIFPKLRSGPRCLRSFSSFLLESVAFNSARRSWRFYYIDDGKAIRMGCTSCLFSSSFSATPHSFFHSSSSIIDSGAYFRLWIELPLLDSNFARWVSINPYSSVFSLFVFLKERWIGKFCTEVIQFKYSRVCFDFLTTLSI